MVLQSVPNFGIDLNNKDVWNIVPWGDPTEAPAQNAASITNGSMKQIHLKRWLKIINEEAA